MEKVIYENESGKLVASANGGVVDLTQYLGGEIVGAVSMYFEEVEEISEFINQMAKE